MNRDQWWKNFSMRFEVEVAGSFIYNGLISLHRLEWFNRPTDIFEILYNLSVGVERLQKVALVLLEHGSKGDVDEFEASIRHHSTLALSDRIDDHVNQKLAPIHKEFLSMLTEFYAQHRYGRFASSSHKSLTSEYDMFLSFLSKHFHVKIPEASNLFALPNSNTIRRGVGRVVWRIIGGLYEIVHDAATELRLFSYELDFQSKAGRIFLGTGYEKHPRERLDFVDDDYARKEILLALMNSPESTKHLEFMRNVPPLAIDMGLTPALVRALISPSSENLSYVQGEVEESFAEIEDVGDRLKLLDILDEENIDLRGS